jgi:hypothetical protein
MGSPSRSKAKTTPWPTPCASCSTRSECLLYAPSRLISQIVLHFCNAILSISVIEIFLHAVPKWNSAATAYLIRLMQSSTYEYRQQVDLSHCLPHILQPGFRLLCLKLSRHWKQQGDHCCRRDHGTGSFERSPPQSQGCLCTHEDHFPARGSRKERGDGRCNGNVAIEAQRNLEFERNVPKFWKLNLIQIQPLNPSYCFSSIASATMFQYSMVLAKHGDYQTLINVLMFENPCMFSVASVICLC